VDPRTLVGAFDSVAGYRKKIVTCMLAAALGGGALVLGSGKLTTAKNGAEKSRLEAGSLFSNDPNFLAKSNGVGTKELFFKTMMAVLVVIALGTGAVYTSKKLLPRITNLPAKEIRIIETAHLGPRKMLHLVGIGSQRLLVGSTNESITMLADVTYDRAEIEISAQERPGNFKNINGS
jgi:flagellar biogenesis protein FliO